MDDLEFEKDAIKQAESYSVINHFWEIYHGNKYEYRIER
jgi:hypothetical protein